MIERPACTHPTVTRFACPHGGWRRFFFVRRAGPSHVHAFVGPRTDKGKSVTGPARWVRETELVSSAEAERYRNGAPVKAGSRRWQQVGRFVNTLPRKSENSPILLISC